MPQTLPPRGCLFIFFHFFRSAGLCRHRPPPAQPGEPGRPAPGFRPYAPGSRRKRGFSRVFSLLADHSPTSSPTAPRAAAFLGSGRRVSLTLLLSVLAGEDRCHLARLLRPRPRMSLKVVGRCKETRPEAAMGGAAPGPVAVTLFGDMSQQKRPKEGPRAALTSRDRHPYRKGSRGHEAFVQGGRP